MLILDLRYNGNMDEEASILFNQISYDKRNYFNQIVTQLSKKFIDDVDWWAEGPASRNVYSSPLFHYVCCFFLVEKMVSQKKLKYEEIIVDCKDFYIILNNFFNDNNIIKKIKIRHRDNFIKRTVLKPFFLSTILFLKIFLRFLSARFTKNHRSENKINNLILVDTYMLPNYVNEDRWYGEFWNNLDLSQKNQVHFVPTIVMTSVFSYLNVFNKLRNNKRNFLIKEDFLKYIDIIWSFRSRKRLKNKVIDPIYILEYNFSPLIKNELLNNTDFLTVIESLLTYKFIKRIKKSKLDIKLVINWFEGQSIDKMWNLGFKDFYPTVKKIGLRGGGDFPFALCSFPISIEQEAGVLPDIFAVQGKGSIATVSEFLKNIDIIVVPSFRSLHVWNEIKYIQTKDNYVNILVTLPIMVSVANRIIKLILEISQSVLILNSNIKFLIKTHPACRLDKEYHCLKNKFPDNVILSSENSFPKLIRQTRILISEASSTCLESLAIGVPVIVINNNSGLTHNPIPNTISNYLYKLVHTRNELFNAIHYYINSNIIIENQQKIEAEKIRNLYFEPMSKYGLNLFLNIK